MTLTWTDNQVAATVHKHLRVRGILPHSEAERVALALAGAFVELFPAIGVPGATRALRVGRDDVITITVDNVLSDQDKDDIAERAKAVFPGHRVVVLERAELTVLRPSQPDSCD